MTPPRWKIVRYEKLDYPEQCSRCKRPITHVWTLFSSENPSEPLKLGSECIKIVTGKTVLQLKKEWNEYIIKTAEEIEEKERLRRVQGWIIANSELIEKLSELSEGKEHYLPLAGEFLDKITEYGTLTEKQLKFVKSLIEGSEKLISRDEFDNMLYTYYTLSINLRLSKYDYKFLSDVFKKALDYGITEKQKEAILKVLKKYRKQINNVLNELLEREKEVVERVLYELR